MITRTPLPLLEPEPYGFIYLGFQAQKPQKMPLYRRSVLRSQAATRLIGATKQLEALPKVYSARVFRAYLVPPLSGAPRHDLAMLVRTNAIEDLDEVRNSNAVRSLGGTEVLVGSNAARIGETEADENAVFLFNHFTVAGGADPIEAWRGLTDWYTSTIGVDNSTALSSIDEGADFPLVNYARLPSNAPQFLLNQLMRPSFHRVVRGTLKRNHMRALPGFYKMLS